MAGWTTEGVQGTPSSGTVLADTGQLPEGGRTLSGIITSAVAGTVLFQWRNAANSSTVMEHLFSMLAGEKLVLPLLYIGVDANDRIRVITSGLVLGNIQASLNWS